METRKGRDALNSWYSIIAASQCVSICLVSRVGKRLFGFLIFVWHTSQSLERCAAGLDAIGAFASVAVEEGLVKNRTGCLEVL